jgi:hypothetical protein
MSVYDDALGELERQIKASSRGGDHDFWINASKYYVSKLLVDELAYALENRTGLNFDVYKDRQSGNKGALAVYLDCECFDPESSFYVGFFNMSDIVEEETAEPLSSQDKSRIKKIANELWKVKCGF